ncbi:MAG TPA: 30S ribosomal protein S7 [Actinomycetota bacterium]|nr:30S ribosomal protein S7 [Actinomycetota bacterium]
MPRKGPITKREVVLDPVYGSALVTQLVNKVLERGKRGTAEHIVYRALDKLKEKTGNDQVSGLKRAIDNIKPQLEVRSRRVGGATYQVPVEVPSRRATTLALRWLVQNSRARREKSMADRLAGELIDAANNSGASVKRKEDLHKMAESNKAFAHYRW